MSSYQIIQGDCRDVLKTLPDESVQCVVTSPPYWGLRDYGVDGQFGLEPTPDEYVADLVAIMREVRRVLRDDGTLWLNLGDSYTSTAEGTFNAPERIAGKDGRDGDRGRARARYRPFTGLKPKNLVGIPWRVAFALQADGWWLRLDIIWSKPNPMPESVTDRPTRAHEYVFLLTKSQRYFYDAEAIKEGFADKRMGNPGNYKLNYSIGSGRNDRGIQAWNEAGLVSGRNKRSVWTITTQPYHEAHFAVFPEKLVEPCVLAGTSEQGCCKDCGEPMQRGLKRVDDRHWTERRVPGVKWARGEQHGRNDGDGSFPEPASQPDGTWYFDTRRCVCHTKTKPCTVLDPFAGAGTVGVVCSRLGRDFIGIELNPEYCDMARKRLTDTPMSLFAP